MNQNIIIRNETPADYDAVEKMTRLAFYNLYVPGCNEHYLVRMMRPHPDFVPELDLVLELEGRIIGNVMYTKTKLVEEAGEERHILTFGPVCIAPEYQRMGYGKLLLEESFRRALALGYDVIVIFGNPNNYVSRGFISCKKRNISLSNGVCPSAMMVKELKPDVLDGRHWIYRQSAVFDDLDEVAAERYDETLEPMEKKFQPSQEEFYISVHSIVQ